MNPADAPGFLLVFLIGFAAHRASLCTVRAVMQWLDERKASVIIRFVKAAAWASSLPRERALYLATVSALRAV